VAKLLLARHGQSVWNEKNIFTGWVDVPLSLRGIEESVALGKLIASHNIDRIYTSALVRAQMTAFIAMVQHPLGKVLDKEPQGEIPFVSWYKKGCEDCIPVLAAWELNERMYGDLQGKNKQEVMDLYGQEQVQRWRRSFKEAPPGGESLYDTARRVLPFFYQNIVPRLASREDVFVCAHGNSLRAIVMEIESLSEQQVPLLEVATGEVLIYSYDEEVFTRL